MLKDKTAVITGGSRGIGRAIALRLAADGNNVAIVYAGNTDAAQETCAMAREFLVEAKAYKCDVGSFLDTKQTIADIINDFGGIDILVNNAGIIKDGLIMSMKEKDFDDVINTNLKGCFNMIKHTYGHFAKKRCGKIVNITSISGVMGNAGQGNYAAAKAGMIGLTKTVAKELAGRGVNCNAVAPGFIKTDMTATLKDNVIEYVNTAIPMKKMGQPQDIAGVVSFLCSGDSDYITGQVLNVDGGLLM